MTGSDPAGGAPELPGYFGTRLAHDPNRAAVWRHVTDYLARWIPADSRVLELGAGWCDFANLVQAAEVVALDADPTVERAAGPCVTAVVGDCTDLSRFDDGRFDVVFASNLVEHLDREAAERLVDESRRVLRPGGRLILLHSPTSASRRGATSTTTPTSRSGPTGPWVTSCAHGGGPWRWCRPGSCRSP